MASARSTSQPPQICRTPSHSSSDAAEPKAEHASLPYWDENGASRAEIRNYIYGQSENEEFKERELEKAEPVNDASKEAEPVKNPSVSQFEDTDYGSWQDAPNSKCHASFGDKGTTATVGAFGQLLQFSDYLGVGSSGMFCVDHEGVPEPYYVVARAAKLHGLSQEPFHCDTTPLNPSSDDLNASELDQLLHDDELPAADQHYGLRFPNLVMIPDAQPRLKWIHWRWPCYEYSAGQFRSHPKLKLTIQWMIRDKTIWQRCTLENHGERDVELEFCKAMIIRDLDHLDDSCEFNESNTKNYDNWPGPGRYSWVYVRRFNTMRDIEGPKPRYRVQDNRTNIQSCLSNTIVCDRIQGGEDLTDSHTSTPEHAGYSGASASATVQRSGQEDGSRHDEPLQDTVHPDPESYANPLRKESDRESAIDSQDFGKDIYGISVISSVFIDGKVQQFGDINAPQKWKFTARGAPTPGQPATHEVTVAYKLNLLRTHETDWKPQVILWPDTRADEFPRDQRPESSLSVCLPASTKEAVSDPDQTGANILHSGSVEDSKTSMPPEHHEVDKTGHTQTPYFSIPTLIGRSSQSTPMQKHLDFAARRNLDHILSVCSIPVNPTALATTSDDPLPEALVGVDPIALTCGDMSGHRICWSASFFAFRFLISVDKILRALTDEPLAQSVLGKIDEICRGHLKWLHLIHRQNGEQHFGANYWVTGEPMIKSERSFSWVAGESLLDTAFQILKAEAYTKLGSGNEIGTELMSQWALPWLISMEKSDKRKKYAWPHAEIEGVSSFRLDDHVWIWRALKSLDKNNRRAWNLMSKNAKKTKNLGNFGLKGEATSTTLSNVDVARLRKAFASDILQREVAKRFTTRNDVQQRMLAVSRSPRENRFLLHSRDTAMFYTETFDFFEVDTSLQELWRSTLDCQRYHDENQESTWETILRHALCIVVGTREHRINKESPDELVRVATNVLFGSSSPNGLFPGRLRSSVDESWQDPIFAESQRDSYYHATFEIPYILLTHADSIHGVFDRPASSKVEGKTSGPNHNTRLGDAICPHWVNSMLQPPQPNSNPSPSSDEADRHQRILCLSNLVFSQSKVAFHNHRTVCQDDGGVAKHQRFTMKKSTPFNHLIDSSNIVKLEDEWMFNYPNFFSREKVLEEDDYEKARRRLNHALIHLETGSKDKASNKYFRTELDFHMIDVPSRKLMGGKDVRPTHRWSLQDAFNLSPVRKAESAKKRLIYLKAATKEAASICIAATEGSERENMLLFFNRHSRYDKHSTDQCSMVHNSWESEFHLSYYQLLEEPIGIRGIPQPDDRKIPGGNGKYIARTAVSFRFNGDFFDRFWTCHMLEYTHQHLVMAEGLFGSKDYRQRKILEQHYFLSILKSLNQSMRDILAEVKHCLAFERGSLSAPIRSNAAYTTWSAVWGEFEPLIQILEDDLVTTEITIGRWESREEDRGKDQPRWTRNDERKHRASITRVRRDIKHEKDKLKHLHANVKSLRESYSDGLVKAREELSFRSEQNIAMFTYVTVVFLPLGFTASVFSMSGSPERSLAINMVVASIIALAVTMLALMNAKGLLSVAGGILASLRDLTDDAKKSSVLIRNRQKAKEEAIRTKGGDPKPPHVRVSPTDAIPWDLVFWIGFLFIELPSRSITTACGAFGWPQLEDKPQDMKDIVVAVAREIAHGVRMCLESGEDNMGDPESHQRTTESVAQTNMGAGDQRHGDKNECLQKIARVLLGLFTVPVFLPLWILQILCFYAWDTLALLGEFLRQGISHMSLPDSNGFEFHLMTRLTKPSEELRPMKGFKDRLRSKREALQKKARNNAGRGKETVSSREETSQARE